ncbi:hypothetical protein DIS18_05400 [Algibacter marinivivus]|uniref:PKD domain-containing protein n=1 Tax=Algibacter marinivivus TaxID=2100723 RepID=A0A2U2X887_9FLAO|nr:T9SS type B sorting domain-containing protein [Algibacter marinivivus]PWH83984.1 hypothetical protein DIS18_05400 [Algibacter marinivivus]
MQRWSFIFLIITTLAYSQKEANIWYFGEHAGLDFNSGSPVVLLDGALNTNEGCATISDSNGNLLFYTDGVTVYNKNHMVMPNGNGLSGNFSSTHSAIIVPKPQEADLYYIFTVDSPWNNNNSNGLSYSEVDMSLESGLGDVTNLKNITMETPVNEKVTAIINGSEDGYWIVSHRHNSDEFLAFEVTNSGVNLNPVVSAVGAQTGFFNIGGQIKISPDNSRLAVARGGEVQLFDFDNVTGAITNAQTIDSGSVNSYGIEFSANGNLLYVAFYGGVYQYNLQAGTLVDIIASQVSLISVSNEGFASMQIAPDGKIYVARQEKPYVDFIENPNVVGIGCGYNYEGLFLGGRESDLGLPTFIQSFFYIGFEFENLCFGDSTQFNANISQTYDSLLWDFGDGSTSVLENPTHVFSVPGDYSVTLTVTIGSQVSSDTKNITIYELPTVTPLVELRQCDDNLDGFSVFNLTEVYAELSTDYLNETITFYESQVDAESDNNPIVSDTAYLNQTVSIDIVWARVENTNECYRTSQINLVVSTTQIPNTYTRDFYKCDDGADTTDGIATFDLSSVNTEIETLFPLGQQLNISYYRNQSDALTEINPIIDIASYENLDYPNTQDVFVRIDSALDNDCLGLGHHITLHVETVPVANPVSVEKQCDDDGDGMYAFNTSAIESLLIGSQTNITTEYIDENGSALSSPLPNPFLTASHTITARLINSTSQDPNGACYDETQIVFTVDAAAVAYTVLDFIACDTDNDGQFAFDTSNIEATVLNGQTGMNVFYFDSDGNTLVSPLPNPFTTPSQTIYVRVENQLSAICYDETTIDFIVNEQPIANPIMDVFVCDDMSNDGEEMFTLSNYNSQILNGQLSSTFEVLYFDNMADAQNNMNALPNSHVVNSTSQTLYARIHNSSNTSCYDLTSFELGVHYLPIVNKPENISVCDDVTNDGFETFDLSNQNMSVLNGQSTIDNTISYHLSLTDAETDINELDLSFTNTENPQTIYVRLENKNFTDCYTITSFQIIVNEQPVLLMDDQWPICEGNTVEIIADAGYDEYLWSTGETSQIITVDAPGNYEITVANIYGTLRCEASKTLTVVESNIATITNIETVDWTQDDNVIIVFVEGNGDYEYSLDNIIYQDSNEFKNLFIDEYTVYVRDKRGCGIATEDIYLLYYPRFFTPNNDGCNDTWQLENSIREPNNKIYIFDRYGKLVKQLSPIDIGWDGTFNGSKLPSNDYWFVLERQNGKTYRGHFTLKM